MAEVQIDVVQESQNELSVKVEAESRPCQCGNGRQLLLAALPQPRTGSPLVRHDGQHGEEERQRRRKHRWHRQGGEDGSGERRRRK